MTMGVSSSIPIGHWGDGVVEIDGRAQTGYGTACKNPDGTWQISN